MSLSHRRFLEAYKKRNFNPTLVKHNKQKPPKGQETVEQWMARTGKQPEQIPYLCSSNAPEKSIKEMQTIKQRGEITYEESKRRK